MYREVVEHPRALPESIKQHLDLTSGRHMGRIYRIVPIDFRQPRIPRLSQASTSMLVANLESRNAWRRRTAARLLYERADTSAAPLLRRLSRDAALPEGRIAALYALAGLDRLNEADVIEAMGSEHSEIQRHGIRLSESMANGSKNIRHALYDLAGSCDPRVQQQLAFSLGELRDPRRFTALAEIAAGNLDEPLVLEAVASSLREGAGPVLSKLQSRRNFYTDAAGREFLAAILRQIGRQQTESDVRILSSIMALAAEDDLMKFIFICNHVGISRDGALFSQIDQPKQIISQALIDSTLRHARAVAGDQSQPQWQRIEAIGILRMLTWDEFETLIDGLLTPNESDAIQQAVLDTIGHFEKDEVARFLVERWRSLSVNRREKALTVLYSRRPWSAIFLDAVDAGKLTINDIGASGLTLFAAHPSESIRARAAKHQRSLQQNAEELLKTYQPALEDDGDVSRGEQVFRRLCSACHQHNGVGYPLGPNLSTTQSRGAEALILNIVAPNAEVNPRYLSYIVLTNDGIAHAGMIKSETATTVTLQRGSDETISILRSDIDSMSSTELSLMPDGLEREIDVAAMADLLAFLRSTD